MDPTVSLPSDAGDEDTAVAVETTSKSSDQRQSSQEVEGGGKGGRAFVCITTRERRDISLPRPKWGSRM